MDAIWVVAGGSAQPAAVNIKTLTHDSHLCGRRAEPRAISAPPFPSRLCAPPGSPPFGDFPRRWICTGGLRYQAPMNRKQRRVEARLGQQGRATGSPALAQWFGAALAHQRRGSAAEAERVCREILSVDPGHAPTLHLLGLIEHQRGRSEDAIEHLRRAIERNGRDPAFHHNLGNILRARDRAAEAIACYERALTLAPG